MEIYYLVIVVLLFLLAISDLIVGVSNDAVNFLNSAVGSKAASFNTILVIAAIGILIGATFSSGMMEVARKGIFHPEMFYFDEIMVIFLAVMLTDIILLDLFNTYGLPTSTTVSIVFEILGGAVGVAMLKIMQSADSAAGMADYINSASALGIISGIFVSIIIAFTVGAVIQWIVRLLFSFNTEKTLKYWGGIWGGIAVSALTYFMLIKGAKGASFMSEETVAWIGTHTRPIIFLSFLGGGLIFQFLVSVTRVNILKIIVLIGTFSLAMAFAGNDLVNFIGVPLAGFESFKAYSAAGVDPDALSMGILAAKVKTPTMFLLIAGLIMALTLRFNKKARTVTATTINLSSQNLGKEKFQSSALARVLVRTGMDISAFFEKITPVVVRRFIHSRFDKNRMDKKERKKQESLAFDLIRASVNLVVAAILISIGTSLKLPLSTTYVTFMVTMGSSLSDKAWGRESAVYRISGVITVVGGWFLTALSAFTAAFIMSLIISFGGMVAISILAGVVVFIVIRTHLSHKKKSKEDEELFRDELKAAEKDVRKDSTDKVKVILISLAKLYYVTILNFTKEKRKALSKNKKDIKEIQKQAKKMKSEVYKIIDRLAETDVEGSHFYVQVVDYLKESTNCLQHIINPLYEHVDNNHQPLTKTDAAKLLALNEKISELFNFSLTIVEKKSYSHLDELKEKRDDLIDEIARMKKAILKEIKKDGLNTKVTMVYLDTLTESKNMLLFVTNVVESMKSFVNYK